LVSSEGVARVKAHGRAARGELYLTYEEFKAFLRQEGERRATQGGLVPIPDLRVSVPLDRETFDEYVLRLHAERLIHLLSHVDGQKLPEPLRSECIAHSSGALLYWIRWL
jgi:hypothetical protein